MRLDTKFCPKCTSLVYPLSVYCGQCGFCHDPLLGAVINHIPHSKLWNKETKWYGKEVAHAS